MTTMDRTRVASYPRSPLDPAGECAFWDSTAAAWQRDTGTAMNVTIHTPVDYTVDLSAFADAVTYGEFDVVLADMTYLPLLAPDLAVIDPATVKGDVTTTAFTAATLNGTLLGIPIALDQGVLLYRRDLLLKHNYTAPPKTWTDLSAMTSRILSQEPAGTLAGYMTALRSDDAFTSSTIEWMAGAGLGPFLVPNGTLTAPTTSPSRLAAVASLATTWRGRIRTGTVAPFALGASPAYAIKYWADGRAVFLRYGLAAGVAAAARSRTAGWDWGVTGLPGETEKFAGASTAEGWVAVVPKTAAAFSGVAERAARYFLTDAVQRAIVTQFRLAPARAAVATDPTMCPAIPALNTRLVYRPAAASGAKYSVVSQAIAETWRSVLTGQSVDPARAITGLSSTLASILSLDVLGPPTNVSADSDLALLVTGLGLIGLFAVFNTAIALTILKKRPRIRRLAPSLMTLMLSGLCLGYISVFVYIGVPTAATCILRPWVLGTAFTVTLAASGFKNFRIFIVVCNPYAKTAKLDDRQLFRWIGGVLAALAVLLVAWMVADPPRPIVVDLATSRYVSCGGSGNGGAVSTFFLVLVYLFMAVLLCVNLFVAAKTRRAGKDYSESKAIGISIHTITLLALVTVTLTAVEGLPQPLYFTVRALAILIATSVFLVSFFFPVLWREIKPHLGTSATPGPATMALAVAPPAPAPKPAPAVPAPEPAAAALVKADPSLSHVTVPQPDSASALAAQLTPLPPTVPRRRGSVFSALPTSIDTATAATAAVIEGALTARRGKSALRLQLAPWSAVRAVFIPSLRILTLIYLSDPDAAADAMGVLDAAVVPLDKVTGVYLQEEEVDEDDEAEGGGAAGGGGEPQSVLVSFVLDAKPYMYEVMAAHPAAVLGWAEAINAVRAGSRKVEAKGAPGAAGAGGKGKEKQKRIVGSRAE
ncbi:hypothetical protein H9P43_006099 [Blastocladiella emersonii ATCC 22665]|nr:hypothetical protein H9P43_006099 [Blastocladiella emersonii ATCC 22665]